MITKVVNNSDYGITNGTVMFPNAYCFVYNPNYIFFELGGLTSVIVEVTDGTLTYSVTCSLYKGSGKCYVSRLMELLFGEEYLSKRSTKVTLSIYGNDSAKGLISSSSSVAIWGSMKIGDTFGGGTMLVTQTTHAKFVREVRWFKAYPFKVSLFSPSTSKSLTLSEDGGTEKTVQSTTTEGIFEVTLTNTSTTNTKMEYKVELEAETIKSSFTNVFDKTFTGTLYKYLDEILKVRVSDEKEGYYVRWIDQFGFLEYWLFRKGSLTNKNKLGSTTIEIGKPIDGIFYPNHKRVTHIKNEPTIKCGAINLTRGEYKTISTVLVSPHVDLFKGYDIERNEIWEPINVVAGSYKSDENKILQDFELQFTMPDTASQNL